MMSFALMSCLRRSVPKTGQRSQRMRLAHEVYAPAGSSRVFVPRLYPIEDDNCSLDPLIYHIRLEKTYPSLVDGIMGELEGTSAVPISREYIEDLIAFGSIYYTSEQGGKARRIQGGGEDLQATKDAYLRVHLNPRRYPAALELDIGAGGRNIIYEDYKLICCNKPEGVPTTETVDNLLESLRGQLHSRRGNSSGPRLETASRLDACTQGCVVFAKLSKDGDDLIGRLNKSFRERKVIKRYRLRCRRKPKILEGTVTHWYKKPKGKGSTPGILYLANDDSDSLSPCHLEIISAEESGTNNEDGEPMWLVEVILGTGLTHQIRLQFAALGASINGDSRYRPAEGHLIDPAKEQADTTALPLLGDTVTGGIDLQCASMTFPAGTLYESDFTFAAACPDWWV